MALKENSGMTPGEINNVDQLISRGKALKLLTGKGGKFYMGTVDVGSEATFRSQLKTNPATRFKLWRSILIKETGANV